LPDCVCTFAGLLRVPVLFAVLVLVVVLPAVGLQVEARRALLQRAKTV
jgi:hypothetical protein